jgi:peroxin-3
MALLPTIGDHIIEGMDVEGLTNDLQEKSRAARLARVSRTSSPDGSSVRQDQDFRLDMDSSIISSVPEDSSVLASTTLGESTLSWVDDLPTPSRNNVVGGSPDPSALAYSATESGTESSRNESPSRDVST